MIFRYGYSFSKAKKNFTLAVDAKEILRLYTFHSIHELNLAAKVGVKALEPKVVYRTPPTWNQEEYDSAFK